MIAAILYWKFRAANGYAYAFATISILESWYEEQSDIGLELPKVFLAND